MRRYKTVLLFATAILGLAVTVAPQVVQADAVSTSETSSTNDVQGVWGTTNWSLDSAGTLHLSGGTLGTSAESPWKTNEIAIGKIRKIVTDDQVTAEGDLTGLFMGLSSVKTIQLDKLDTTNVTNFTDIFAQDRTLALLDISNWTIQAGVPAQFGKNMMQMGLFSGHQITAQNVNIQSDDFGFSSDKIRWVNISDGTASAPNPKNYAYTVIGLDKLADKIKNNQFEQNTWVLQPTGKVIYNADVVNKDGLSGRQLTYGISAGTEYTKETKTLTDEELPAYQGSTFELAAPEIEGFAVDDEYKTLKVEATTTGLKFIPNSETDNSGMTFYYRGLPHPEYTGPEEVVIYTNLKDFGLENPKVTIPNAKSYKKGDTITVDVPQNVGGYVANKKKIEMEFVSFDVVRPKDYDGADFVTYSKPTEPDKPVEPDKTDTKPSKPSTKPSRPSTEPSTDDTKPVVAPSTIPTIENKQQFLRVYSDQAIAKLFALDGTEVANRALAGGTNWYSDKILDQKYYRVATNEWVSADDVYVYQVTPITVKTHNVGSYVSLLNERGQTVKERGLANNTAWKVDKTVTLNGQKYYRVATNEFVSAADVDII